MHSGSVYPALRALEAEGLIKERKIVGEDGDGHGRACFFELTRKGRQLALEHRQIALAIFFPGNVLDGMKAIECVL
jgi:DNA-binding PadR family transcriptional regulator